jgi:uncharacterized delta-60 repeat protein
MSIPILHINVKFIVIISMHSPTHFFGEIKMKKGKKSKIGILIIGLFFILLYFSIQFGGIGQRIDDETIRDKKVTPFLSAGNSFLYEWNRTWGGGDRDIGNGVAVDSSDKVYVTGNTENFGAGYSDIALVKYDSSGVLQWNRTWGGSEQDIGWGIAVDSSDNIYINGFTKSFSMGDWDIALVKYDENGIQQWNSTWGGAERDIGWGIAVDSSDNIYIIGETESFGAEHADIVLVKYDGNGILKWNHSWGGANWEEGLGVAIDSSSNVYVSGDTYNDVTENSDLVLVKYDENGIQQWNQTWGGVGDDVSWGIVVDSSDNVYLTGYTESFGAGDDDIALVKYDRNGVLLWNRTWGGAKWDRGYGVAVDSSDNVYLAGFTESFGAGNIDMVLVKYDSFGAQQWYRTLGGVESDAGYGVAVDSSNNVYLAGYTYSFGAGDADMILVKYGIAEQPPSDKLIMIVIILVSIASVVGVSITITYVIRKRRKIVE